MTPEPGIHRSIEEQHYHALRLFSNSIAGLLLRKSPAQARHAMIADQEDTDPLRMGSAVHTAVLEPDAFEVRFATSDQCGAIKKKDGERCSREGSVLRDGAWFCSQHDPTPGVEDKDGPRRLSSDEKDTCMAIHNAVWADPHARELLTGQGVNECTVIWDSWVQLPGETETKSVRCKGRIDRLTTMDGRTALVDLKSTTDASSFGFSRAVARYGYHRQAAMYLDGMRAIDRLKGREPMQRRYIFIAVEKEPPYDIGLYELDEDAIRIGRNAYRQALELWKTCEERDHWPTYSQWANGIESISVPEWAQ